MFLVIMWMIVVVVGLMNLEGILTVIRRKNNQTINGQLTDIKDIQWWQLTGLKNCSIRTEVSITMDWLIDWLNDINNGLVDQLIDMREMMDDKRQSKPRIEAWMFDCFWSASIDYTMIAMKVSIAGWLRVNEMYIIVERLIVGDEPVWLIDWLIGCWFHGMIGYGTDESIA